MNTGCTFTSGEPGVRLGLPGREVLGEPPRCATAADANNALPINIQALKREAQSMIRTLHLVFRQPIRKEKTGPVQQWYAVCPISGLKIS
jgi:hypothetical protein